MLRLSFALLAVLLAGPSLAAPAPVGPAEDDAWLRALPDDADVLLMLDVKQFVESPLVKKGLEGKLPSLLSDKFLVPLPLRPLGVDPNRDLKQMAVVMGRSLWLDRDGKPTTGSGMLILMRTGKSEAAIRTKLAELAGDEKSGFKGLPGGKIYEYSGRGPRAAVAVLSGGVLAVAETARPIEVALERVKTEKKPSVKSAEMAKFVKGLTPGPLLSMRMLGDAVVNVQTTRTLGKPGQSETKFSTLAESGFERVRVEAKVKDTIKGKCELECKDAETAVKKVKQVEGMRALLLPQIEEQARKEPRLEPVARAFKAAKITAAGKVVVIEAEIGPDVVKALELADTDR